MVILQKRVAALSQSSLERFVQRAKRAAGLRGMANVLVTSSQRVRALNRQFRGKNKATDVLSFPAPDAPRRGDFLKGALAGEIAISAEIAARNAARLRHTAAQEVKILVLHGILHLAGFDHERDNGMMARQEIRLRQALQLPSGLIERTAARKGSSSLKQTARAGQVGRKTSRAKTRGAASRSTA